MGSSPEGKVNARPHILRYGVSCEFLLSYRDV